ncbi:hypotheticall protein [Colletotrichum tropicale]|nr:hypotheticall protein [Colletotrichum tropicale]
MLPPNSKSTLRVTYITTATVILEIDGVRFLTDLVFDDAPTEYEITHPTPLGTPRLFAKFETGPPLGLHQLPIIDAVLLSHEDHTDILNDEGRKLLDGRRVTTIPDGVNRLALRPGVVPIKPWEMLTSQFQGVESKITGTPCTHLPGGEVTGFVLQTEKFGLSSEGLPNAIYLAGDTVPTPKLSEIRQRFHAAIAAMNPGEARIPPPGYETPPQITTSGKDAAKLTRELCADTTVTVHPESRHHSTQGAKELQAVFEAEGIADRICWATPGEKKIIA